MADEEQTPADSGKSEAELKMEMQRKKQAEKEAEELKEYEEQRKAEREKEQEEIIQLKDRRETRKKERVEEERRLAEARVAEDQKRKEDQNFNPRDAYLRHRWVENSKEKWNKHLKDWDKTRHGEDGQKIETNKEHKEGRTHDAQDSDSDAFPELNKTKEQLEAEKAEAMKQRITPLNTAGMEQAELTEKAKELWNQIYRVESDKYDLELRFRKQRDDMAELAERARQINKGGKGKQAVVPRQEPDHDQSTEVFSGAPPKVMMYSPYERVKDRRSFEERKDVYKGPTFAPETPKIEPESGEKKAEGGEHGSLQNGDAAQAPPS